MIRSNQFLWGPILLLSFITPLHAHAETLQQAWDISVNVNHSLKAAEENTEAARQELESVKANRFPELSVESSYSVLENTPEAIADLGGTSIEVPMAEQTSFSYGAMAMLPLYTSGRITHGIKAADAAFDASITQEAGKKLDLKLRVAETFVGVLRAIRGLDVANSHVTSLKAHADDVENLHEQGMVSRNDLLSAQVSLADAEQEVIKVQNILDITKSAYNRFLGRPLNQVVELDNIDFKPFDEPLESLTDQAISQRHELLTLQKQILALRHQADAIHAKNGPQLALTGGYGYQENQYQVHEGQWSASLGAKWKLFDGGVIKHKSSATKRRAAALQEYHDDMLTHIELQVRQYWLDIQEARKRIQVTDKAAIQAEENLKVNRDRFENGLSTNADVLDAESLRTRSQYNQANALYDAIIATLRLNRAVGEL